MCKLCYYTIHIARPQILPKQNLSPQVEKDGYFPSENPKIKDFRRTSNARPYILIGKSVFGNLKGQST